MSAHPCSAVLGNGETCGAARSAPIHLRTTPGGHPFLDARGAARLAPQSAGRTEYMQSEAHKRAYEHVDGECIFFAGGAPLDCYGGLSGHHVIPKSVSGSIQASERDGVVAPACIGHNEAVESNPELREWAESNRFMWHDGKHWYYRYNPVMYRALRDSMSV